MYRLCTGDCCSTFEKCEQFDRTKAGAETVYFITTTHNHRVSTSRSMHPTESISRFRYTKHPTSSIMFPVCSNVSILVNPIYYPTQEASGMLPRRCTTMNHNLKHKGTDKGTAEPSPYYRYGTYVPSKLVGTRSYWASRQLVLTSMSRELGKGHLFITLSMNDNWTNLQAALQKGCRARALWPGEYPKSTEPNKPIQNGHDMEACVVFHKRVEIFKREFLAIGKNGPFRRVPDCSFPFEYQERARVCLYGAVWCENNGILDDVICATRPSDSDTVDLKFAAYQRELKKECNMVHRCYPDKCSNIGCGLYAPSASRVVPLACRRRETNWMTLECACFIVDMKLKIHLLFHTIAVCWSASSATILWNGLDVWVGNYILPSISLS